MLDTVIVVIFIVASLGVGFALAGRQKGMEGFMLADRELGFWRASCSITSTIAGVTIVYVHAVMAYRFGISIFWSPPAIFIAFLLFAVFASKLKVAADRAGYVTYADMLLDRYDGKTQVAGSLITIANFLALTALNIFGLGVVLSSAFGTSFTTSSVVGMGIVILYTISGGFRGVVINDVLQTVAMVVGIFVLVPVAAIAVSAAGGFWATLPKEHLDPTNWGIDKIIGTYVVVIPVLFSSQDIWQRVFAARDLKTAQRSVIASGIMLTLIAAASTFLGLCGRVLLPAIEADQVLPELAKQLLVPGLTGLVVVAYIAAFAGSADSFLLVISSAVTKDFYLNFRKRKLTDQQVVTASRWITLACGLIPLAIIVQFPYIVAILFTVLTWFMILVPATLGGFFWRKATGAGAFWSILIGWLVAVAYTAATGDAETAGVVAAFPTLIVFYLVSVITQPRAA